MYFQSILWANIRLALFSKYISRYALREKSFIVKNYPSFITQTIQLHSQGKKQGLLSYLKLWKPCFFYMQLRGLEPLLPYEN